jgi:uncharacterized RDD family membrane protein YckC
MAKWFYTDSKAEQKGPVDEETLLELNRKGEINAKSLVWKEGLERWVSFLDVAPPLFPENGEGVPVTIGVCAYSSRVYPIDEMMPYGEALIGEEHKEAFIQQLMESGSVEIADATEKRFEYMGFWWRCLSSFLDYLIKMVPSWICMIPYYIVVFTGGADGGFDSEPTTDFTIAMAVAYGIGLLGMLAVSVWYETWMVGRYQGTVGKLIIGARVVNPDGSRLSYKRAFIRWLAKKPLNYVIVFGPSSIGFGLVIAGISTTAKNADGAAAFGMAIVSGLFVYCALIALCSAVYWMAAFDGEKRSLHDRVAGTRVIKK